MAPIVTNAVIMKMAATQSFLPSNPRKRPRRMKAAPQRYAYSSRKAQIVLIVNKGQADEP